MKLLIADDDPVSRRFLDATLRQAGHETTLAATGTEAEAALQREACDVLVSDYLMPGIDGFELVRRARAQMRDHYLYIILLTTSGGKTRFLGAIEAGVDDFMTKPFDPELLVARLHVAERIVGLRRYVRSLEGLLPICGYCKNVRDAANQWQPVERYIAQRTEAQFSHGICPSCYERIMKPQLAALGIAAPAYHAPPSPPGAPPGTPA